MTTTRLIAIGVIYLFATLAWLTLGTSIVARTGQFDSQLEQEVARLWGGHHRQVAPSVTVERLREATEHKAEPSRDGGPPIITTTTHTVADLSPVHLRQSRVTVDLDLQQRQKGLLWYDTYAVVFTAHYAARNPDGEPRTMGVELHFPSSEAIYDGFVFTVNGQQAPAASDLSHGLVTRVLVPGNGDVAIDVRYRSRGLDDWTYAFVDSGVAETSDFTLTMQTNFLKVDFPPGGLSPSLKQPRDGGWTLGWNFDDLVTGQRIALDLPNRINPGPLAARLTAFAPVSLLFFLVVLVILSVLGGLSLHPMNYAFLSASFFAFHLLLAYLVDHISIHVAFVLSSIVSVALVVSYLRIVAGTWFAVARAGAAQFVFLILFSYAFFFEGYTGLTVTIGAIATLFVLMQATARVDWGAVFAARASRVA